MTCRYYGKHQTLDGHLIDQLGNQCGAMRSPIMPASQARTAARE